MRTMGSVTNYVMLLKIDHVRAIRFLLEGNLCMANMEAFASKTCDGSRKFLRTHKLPTSGKKEVLIRR